jgi:hypothetical protein
MLKYTMMAETMRTLDVCDTHEEETRAAVTMKRSETASVMSDRERVAG